MDTLIALVIAAVVSMFFLRGYRKGLKKRDELARKAAEKGKIFSAGPRSQHPHIDTNLCIGCGTCTTVCPEGDVLAMLAGKAAIVNGHKCIGHSLCAEACPVGAITMVMATPSMGADMPYMTQEYETSIENLFIIGELGGLALIKNAVNQGRDCVDYIIRRRAAVPVSARPGVYDVLIVGAGPAGISRQKLVMTSPVEFPMYGKFKKTELSKENLLAFWDMVLNRADFNCVTMAKVEQIAKQEDGIFVVTTATNEYRARAVILALGKTGTPRKLGVPGEELPKVMYRLIEADHYVNKKILVVGGGDSAVEAAMGLAHQPGNKVTLCYRGAQFSRIKERNSKRIEDCMRSGKVEVLFNTSPVEFKADSAVLDVQGQKRELLNDFVWIFAGGVPPYDFLKKIGIRFGMRDLTQEASSEASRAAHEKQALATAGSASA